MGKVKQSNAAKLRKYIQLFGSGVFSTDGQVLYCQACEKNVAAGKLFQAKQHVSSACHKRAVERNKKIQPLMNKELLQDRSVTFCEDLTAMMLAADIPFQKLSNPEFISFLLKYTKFHVPDIRTFRRNYLKKCYDNTMDKIRHNLADKNIWLSVDETVDKLGRNIGCVIVGALNGSISPPYLLNIAELHKTNNTTIAQLVTHSLQILWPDGLKHEKLLLCVTDAAPYMVKCGIGLQKLLFPKMIHLTCLAHGVNRVAEEIRKQFPKVDQMIATVKKVFLKSPSRVALFKELSPDTPLPPKPVVTRWSSWIDAAVYYSKHYEAVQLIIDSLDKTDAVCIETAQDLFVSGLKEELAYIAANFDIFLTTLTKLQDSKLTLNDALFLLENFESASKSCHGIAAEKAQLKLKKVLDKNHGLKPIRAINDILNGGKSSFEEIQVDLTVDDVANFRYAPITSCNVERAFSRFKALLRSNRTSFTIDNLKMSFVVNCNATIFI